MTEQYKELPPQPRQGHAQEIVLFSDDYAFVSRYIPRFFEAYMTKPQIKDTFLQYVTPDVFTIPQFKCDALLMDGNVSFWFYLDIVGKETKDLMLCKYPRIGRRKVFLEPDEEIELNVSSVQLGEKRFTPGEITYKRKGSRESDDIPDAERRSHVERLYNEFRIFEPRRVRFQHD
jgi:hypothetical protein